MVTKGPAKRTGGQTEPPPAAITQVKMRVDFRFVWEKSLTFWRVALSQSHSISGLCRSLKCDGTAQFIADDEHTDRFKKFMIFGLNYIGELKIQTNYH